MKLLLAAAALAVAINGAAAQVCTVTYSSECETADGYDCGAGSGTVPALPVADVTDNAAKFLCVINQASKEQERGGPYTITLDETRVCDGGTPYRAQGVQVQGLTLGGLTRICDVALEVSRQINDRYRARAKKIDSVGWDHKKAPKVKRNDLGQRING